MKFFCIFLPSGWKLALKICIFAKITSKTEQFHAHFIWRVFWDWKIFINFLQCAMVWNPEKIVVETKIIASQVHFKLANVLRTAWKNLAVKKEESYFLVGVRVHLYCNIITTLPMHWYDRDTWKSLSKKLFQRNL